MSKEDWRETIKYEDLDVRCVIYVVIKNSQNENGIWGGEKGHELNTKLFYNVREKLIAKKEGGDGY